MELVLVATDKYSDPWWVNNMKHMTGIQEVSVITDVVFGGPYDKLRLFDLFKEDKQYIYFDLDVVITQPIDFLLRDELHVLKAWWREPLHTPLNSSIMSWRGDHSFIYKKWIEDPERNLLKYHKGIDEFLYKEINLKTYGPVCTSYRYNGFDDAWPVVIFNQRADIMKRGGKWSKYLL